MSTVTVSSKFQIVIPREIREKNRIVAGQRLQLISLNGRIELVPVREMSSMRGFLKGFDASFERDEEDRSLRSSTPQGGSIIFLTVSVPTDSPTKLKIQHN